MWEFTGQERPGFAVTPGPGEESVWDYPRPPRIEPVSSRVQVRHGSQLLADSTRACRVLETASPPTYYLPPDDVVMALLRPAPGRSHCEWKGEAQYLALADSPGGSAPVAWRYPRPQPEFSGIAGYVGFYPGRVACEVDGERVRPQPGGFYAGWVTGNIVGPFKGEPGTGHW